MAVDLRSATDFALLCAAALSTTGASNVSNGKVGGTSTISGFPPATLSNGASLEYNQTICAQALADARTAYDTVKNGTSPAVYVPGELGGLTLTPNTYYNTGAMTLATGNLTFNGNGLYVFRIGAAMSIAASMSMVMINGAVAEDITFQVTGAFAVGAGVSMVGTILGYAAVSVGTGCTIKGALVSLTGALAVDTSSVTRPDNAAQLAAAAVVAKQAIIDSTSVPLNFTVSMPDGSILSAGHVFGESCTQMIARITAYFIPISVDSKWDLVCSGITLQTENFMALLKSGVQCILQMNQNAWLPIANDAQYTRKIVFKSDIGTMLLSTDNRFTVKFTQRQYQSCFSSTGEQQVWINANNEFLLSTSLMSTITATPITVVICTPLVIRIAQLVV